MTDDEKAMMAIASEMERRGCKASDLMAAVDSVGRVTVARQQETTSMRLRDGYVCADGPDGFGQVWMGRLMNGAFKPNSGFEATLRQATAWTLYRSDADLSEMDEPIEIAGVPVFPETFQAVWAWVSAGSPVEVAATEFCGVRGVAVRGSGRVAIMAQCIELSELEGDA